jgi:response regulator RpfG family c-di-GMP phosphodiesterase
MTMRDPERSAGHREAEESASDLPDGLAESPGSHPDIAQRVLGYFSRNSEAMDSVEGIARFWVREDRAAVERCLADLHARGLLERRVIAGTDFYSLARERFQPAPSGSGPAAGATAPHGAGAGGGAAPYGAAASGEDAAGAVGADGSGEAAGAMPVAPQAVVPSSGKRGRVLVVDDDPGVRRFLVEALTEAGHSVAAAEDGERAIEIFRSHPCDVVVSDVRMGRVSGLDVLRAVKEHSPTTEVIILTAHATLDTAVTAMRHGAYDLITKPLADLETLDRLVRRALEKQRLSVENRLLVDNLQARNLELKETVARLAAVNEIGKATTGLLDMNELYDSLVRLVAQHLKARRVSVLISVPDSDTMTLAASVGIPEHEAQNTRVKVGEGIAGRVAASQSPLLVRDIEQTSLKAFRTGGKYTTASFMITPLNVSYPIRYQRRRVGVINVSDKHSGDPFTEQDLEFLSTLSSQVAVAIENARLVREMENGYLGAVVALIQAAEDARPESRGHSRTVVELAAAVGRAVGLPDPRVELLARAAALHEVGRLAVRPERDARGREPAASPPAWTPEAVMATERVLAPIASLRAARDIILRSADPLEPATSPIGAERPGIPVESRILAICEEFALQGGAGGADADAARRALEAVRRKAGSRQDLEVVQALARVVGAEGRR